MNILITGVGGPAGRALVSQLATTSHNVVGVDMQEVALADIDSFELVPAANDPDMINQLAALVDITTWIYSSPPLPTSFPWWRKHPNWVS